MKRIEGDKERIGMAQEQAFGPWVKRRRKALDLTREELADQIGCSPYTIYKIETGERRPSKQIAELLLSALNVPPEEHPELLLLARQRTEIGRAEEAEAPALPAGLVARPSPLPTTTLLSHPVSLPVQFTSFIGREGAIAGICQLLEGEAHVVTLTGPGGVGKTRLAQQVALRMQRLFADGVFFVPLAPLRASALAIPAIAQALGVKEVGDQPELALLKAYLRDKQILLVLDNTEQLPDLAPLLIELLSAASGLKLLITSRIVLKLTGEQSFSVPPLSMPDPASPPSFRELLESEAVRLFIERAQAVRASIMVTPERAAVIAEVCRRLDGLPLAIELAAARSRIFTPEVLLEQLSQRLELLKRGGPDLPERHQTLRQTIDWSYQLLSLAERRLLSRLAVFVGGCSAQALAAVFGGDQRALLEEVEALIEQSMLLSVEQPDQTLRFIMLETIREYAVERLGEDKDEQALRESHARYYLSLAQQAAPELLGARQQTWLDQLEREHNNLRAALDWLIQSDPAGALALASALWRFWYLRGHLNEGRRWQAQALAALPQPPPSLLAEALSAMVWLADSQGDYVQAQALCQRGLEVCREHGLEQGEAMLLYQQGRIERSLGGYAHAGERFEQSLALARAHDNRWLVATLLNGIGWAQARQGDFEQALRLLEESLALTRQVGDQERLAAVILTLGSILLIRGDYERAQGYLEQSRKLSAEIGDKLGLANSLTNLGLALLHLRSYNQARSCIEESKRLCSELNDRLGVASSLTNLGDLAFEAGDYQQARSLYREGLGLAHELQSTHIIAICVDGLACVAAALGQPLDAATLFGVAEGLYGSIGVERDATNESKDAALATLRGQLEPEDFARALARGMAMPLDQAIGAAMR